MGVLSIILIGLGLSMDAFAVSVSNGMCIRDLRLRHALKIAGFFGGFQALMPVVGWAAGFQFKDYIISYDHWIAFVLLSVIGAKMIKEALESKEEEVCSMMDEVAISEQGPQQTKAIESVLEPGNLLVLAVATSIDALAVGISFAFFKVSIVWAALVIGLITLITCTAGVYIGKRFGGMMKKQAEIAGGIILVLIGLKILVEHLGLIHF